MGKSQRVMSNCKHHGMAEHYVYGKSMVCAVCAREKKKEYYRKNPEKLKASSLQWMERNKDRLTARSAELREKKRMNRKKLQLFYVQKYEPTIKQIYEACGLPYTLEHALKAVSRTNPTDDNIIDLITLRCKSIALRSKKAEYSWTASTLSKYHHGLLVNTNGTTYSYYEHASEEVKEAVRKDTREYTALRLMKDAAPIESKLETVEVKVLDIENPLLTKPVELLVVDKHAKLRAKQQAQRLEKEKFLKEQKLARDRRNLENLMSLSKYKIKKLAGKYNIEADDIEELRVKVLLYVSENNEGVHNILIKNNELIYGLSIGNIVSGKFFLKRFDDLIKSDFKLITNLLLENNIQMNTVIEKQAAKNRERREKSPFGLIGVYRNAFNKDCFSAVTIFGNKKQIHGSYSTLTEAADAHDKLAIEYYGYHLAKSIGILNYPHKHDITAAVNALFHAGYVQVLPDVVVEAEAESNPEPEAVVETATGVVEAPEAVVVKEVETVLETTPQEAAEASEEAAKPVIKRSPRKVANSGYKGVQVRKERTSTQRTIYICRLKAEGKEYYKTFRTPEGAALHYNTKMIEIYGKEKATEIGLNKF
jgi:hypothetical protein